jgi:hypothetical protein
MDETSGAHCTDREEVKYVKKILVRKPEGIIPLLRRGISSFGGLEVACWDLVPKFAG